MSAKPIVLVVEGSPGEGETLKRVLNSTHYHAVFVDNAEDAMAHVESPINLVLSGVTAEQPNGRELINRWKARRPEVPFILVTHSDECYSLQSGNAMGADGCVRLPATGNELSTQLAKWLANGQQPPANVGNTQTNTAPAGQSELAATVRIPPGTTLEQLERFAVEQSLEQHHGNRTHAAKELGISVRTLQRKLKAWGELRDHSSDSAQMREPTMRHENGSKWNGNPASPRQITPRPRMATA